MTDVLATLLTRQLPAILAKRPADDPRSISFRAEAPEGAREWTVYLRDGACVEGLPADGADVVVSGKSAALELLLRGGLDVSQALRHGVIRVDGSLEVLDVLATALGRGTT